MSGGTVVTLTGAALVRGSLYVCAFGNPAHASPLLEQYAMSERAVRDVTAVAESREHIAHSTL